ncbi:type II toxin-antitoxin system VapC family toxin [Beijerinckia sp. L45]|uniref:type II toxin-antitoxin system VapC family toxin n=1 Tax=Beijerinckia sp. L45 TaxID=1641855 RepID=UPI00131A85D2|nr:type II toxin-antitoxin system VapC family toxin [Beijerinckia sp. L45]
MPLVYLDTGVFIHAFEFAGPRPGLFRDFFADLARYPLEAVTSELTLAELLAPIKAAGAMTIEERQDLYLPLFDEGAFIALRPISRTVLLRTAPLRQSHPQRLPDAIHIATAVETGCHFFMAPDTDARRLPPALTWIRPDPDGIATVLKALDA